MRSPIVLPSLSDGGKSSSAGQPRHSAVIVLIVISSFFMPAAETTATPPAPGTDAPALHASREVAIFRDVAIPRSCDGGGCPTGRVEPIVSGVDDAIVVPYNNGAVAVSADAGRTFRTIYPDRLFPRSPFPFSKGNCCDNWITQDPSRRLIFWLMQYNVTGDGPNDENGLRLAVAHSGADVAGDRWKTFDITLTDLGFGPGHAVDRPMMAVSSNYLYVSTVVSTTVNFFGRQARPAVVVRMALNQIVAGIRPDMQVVRPEGGFGLLPVSGATTTMYFGCYICGSSDRAGIRVLVWPEAENAPTIWQSISAITVPASSARCADPSGVDPCGGADPNHTASAYQPMQAGWLARGELGFMWHSAASPGRPFPFTRVAILDPDTLEVRAEPDIWSASHALLFPAVAVNARGHLGGTIAALGGDTYQTIYGMIRDDLSGGDWDFAPVASGRGSLNTFGDYLGAVAHPTSPNTWLGVGYVLPQGSDPAKIVMHQFWMGRSRDDPSRVPTRTVYLPNITKTLGGATGWQTPFIIQNVGSVPTDLEVNFYRFGSNALVAQRFVDRLQPGTSFAEVPNNSADLPDGGQFSVVVRSFGAPIVAVVNEHQGVGQRAEALSYVGLSHGSTRVSLPYVAKDVGGWLVTFIMQNLGLVPTTVSISLQPESGQPVTLTRNVAPGASAFVNPAEESALQSGAAYAVTLSSTQPIAVVANAHNDAAHVSAPMGFSYNGILSSAASVVYAPYVVQGVDGRTTRVVIQNMGTTAATPLLALRSFAGGPPTMVSGPQVAAGSSFTYLPSTLANGEYALTVAGGAFAVLVSSASATDAMGYTGSAAASPRSYLPNVTRTLGGSTGWTTPIVVQSAGASGVTVRWHRFTDGALVATHTISGLTPGASARVDPRSVSGLTDNTQYAVVADGTDGQIVAIVTELNFEGGDGAMVYEGFPAAP